MRTLRSLTLLALVGLGGAIVGAASVNQLNVYERTKADHMELKVRCHEWAHQRHWSCLSTVLCTQPANDNYQAECLKTCNDDLEARLRRCANGKGPVTQAEMDELLRWLHTDAGRPYAPEDFLRSDASAPSTP